MLAAWRTDCNHVRPHSALANCTPDEFRHTIAIAATVGNGQNFNPGPPSDWMRKGAQAPTFAAGCSRSEWSADPRDRRIDVCSGSFAVDRHCFGDAPHSERSDIDLPGKPGFAASRSMIVLLV